MLVGSAGRFGLNHLAQSADWSEPVDARGWLLTCDRPFAGRAAEAFGAEKLRVCLSPRISYIDGTVLSPCPAFEVTTDACHPFHTHLNVPPIWRKQRKAEWGCTVSAHRDNQQFSLARTYYDDDLLGPHWNVHES